MAKERKNSSNNEKTAELLADLQRTRADFENYRKNMQMAEARSVALAENHLVTKLLPIVDDIERAVQAMPDRKDPKFDKWLEGFKTLGASLGKSLAALEITKIDSSQGAIFNPDEQEAVSFEDSDGDNEVVAEELQSGYKFRGVVIRPAMVKVKKG